MKNTAKAIYLQNETFCNTKLTAKLLRKLQARAEKKVKDSETISRASALSGLMLCMKGFFGRLQEPWLFGL